MKRYGLKTVICLILTAAFIAGLVWWSGITAKKTAHGIRQASYMYAQPENTIDVVMMGSSRVHCNINTAVLWDLYGYACYDYSAAEQPLWLNYYYLQEICKTQKPRAVVLDLYCPARFKEDYQERYLDDNLFGVRFSLNKLKMLAVSCTPRHWLRYFPSFFANHARYDKLTEEDWHVYDVTDHEKQAFKGFTPYFNVHVLEEPDDHDVEGGGLTPKSEKYLRKIIDYTKKKGIALMFVVAPYVVEENDAATYLAIRKIAEEEGIPYLDSNEYYDEMGLDFASDYTDHSHLNYTGSYKYTVLLANKIHQCMDIPDRRGNPLWESWDRNRDAIYAEVFERAAQQNG